ncbi:amylo-alpha-1,6-glucosidase [Telmatospirillum sp. J64-1]|uniref:amylo-alpha-1,6-glucosidase n=1 Tax=Telmatospirillum sp. J64-1 TaxID=2502183 RepID=UPI00115F03BD|nr:amylo-alpha-1,6-glucosidase [Telmatospirillum sp. J64-1]
MTQTLPQGELGTMPGGTPVFYIPATASLQERRPRTLKHGDTFAVFDHNGDIVSGPGSPEGLFHSDTRHLSHMDLTLHGARPLMLSSTLRADNATLTCDLTNPDIYRDGELVLEHDLVHVRRTKFLWRGACFERLGIRNFSGAKQQLRLDLHFAADFADLFEVRGNVRKKRGTMASPSVDEDAVVLRYTGLDGRQRLTCLRFEPVPDRLSAENASFDITLPPHGNCTIFIEITFAEPDRSASPARLFRSGLREARHALRDSSSRMTAVATSNEIFNEVARRAVADLRMLVTDTPEGPFPYAGIPWFSTAFGRDAIITALECLWMDPDLSRGVLRFLAARQAATEDPEADAEPGKILHETRQGEMAALGEVPFRRYYGSVDSTPLFIVLAGAYYQRTGDLETIRTIWPNIQAALSWIDRYGDRDGDGFVEYGRRTEQGLANQGWKDSHDSIFHADGQLARGPIALVEVQGYVYAAKQAAAALARALGEVGQGTQLELQAEALRERFEASFWDEELGTYVLALDGDKRPCRVVSSNAGHALFTGIAAPERARRVASTLMDSRSFCGWGIRTIAAGQSRYNPMSYHNGSVWPHDNALIALGFARYGLMNDAARLLDGLFEAASHMDLRRLPELFCGFARRPGRGPTLYPVACIPQAWAAVAPLALLQACLGLRIKPESGVVCFERPVLPRCLDEVTIRGLRLNAGSIDIQLKRHINDVAVTVLDRSAEIEVVSIR